MSDKFDYYDILGVMVPGTILLLWIPICFPGVGAIEWGVSLPEAFLVVALLIVAFFMGHVLQALASIAEALLFWTWGGRPSDGALNHGLRRYLPPDTVQRVRKRLAAAAGPQATDGSLFLFAMHLSERCPGSRVPRFNSLYAYHRGLLVTALVALLILAASARWGAAADWAPAQVWALVIFLAALSLLIWHRTRQRAVYYVREVLLSAEHCLSNSSLPTSK